MKHFAIEELQYKYLGRQNDWKHVYFDQYGKQTEHTFNRCSYGYTEEDYPEYYQCVIKNGHSLQKFNNGKGCNWHYCDICKHYWYVDSSD